MNPVAGDMRPATRAWIRLGWIPCGLEILLAGCTAPPAELQPPGFVRVDLVVHGTHFPCAVHLPAGYDRRQLWPCIVFLHGSGESGDDGAKPANVGLGPAIAAHPERWPFVVVAPQKPSENEEWEEHEDLVLDALQMARRRYSIDPDRVVLTGVSQGGHGTWVIAAHHPELWCALAPVCGYGRALTIAPRVAKLPVWAFHGLRDDVVDPEDTRQIVTEVVRIRRGLGLDPEGPEGARMTLYPDLNHGCWDAAYGDSALAAWMRERRRPPASPPRALPAPGGGSSRARAPRRG